MSPRVVDHDQRRMEIIDVYLRIVAEDGVGGATTRRLAAQLGVANGALWRYFTDTADLLESALSRVVSATDARIAAHSDLASPLDQVAHVVEELLPLTDESQLEARVVVSFWGSASSNLSAYRHRLEELVEWQAHVERLLANAVDVNELPANLDVEMCAKMLIDMTTASQINWVLGDGRVTPDSLKGSVDRLIESMRRGQLIRTC